MSQKCNLFLSSQIKINFPSICWTSLTFLPTGVLKDALQRPVKMSQVLTPPFSSLEITIPSLRLRWMEEVEDEVDFWSEMIESVILPDYLITRCS